MNAFLSNIQANTGLNPEIQLKILISIAIIIALWLLRTAVTRTMWRRTDDTRIRYLWHKITGYAVVVFAILFLSTVWIEAFRAIGTFLGLLSAGLAIALKDLFLNMAGSAFIFLRRPFTLGDRIQIGSIIGDVIDITLFEFTLMEVGNWVDAEQSTGRIYHIPNGIVFTEPVANYSTAFQYIWDEIPITVSIASDWEKAKEIIQGIVDKHAMHLAEDAGEKVRESAKKYLIFYSKLTPIVYTKVTEKGVVLTARYLCEPRNRRGTEQAIWEDILREFKKSEDINFA